MLQRVKTDSFWKVIFYDTASSKITIKAIECDDGFEAIVRASAQIFYDPSRTAVGAVSDMVAICATRNNDESYTGDNHRCCTVSDLVADHLMNYLPVSEAAYADRVVEDWRNGNEGLKQSFFDAYSDWLEDWRLRGEDTDEKLLLRAAALDGLDSEPIAKWLLY